MNSLAPYKSFDTSNPGCADFITLVEQELSASCNAVTDLFGSEQADLAAEDWLNEVITTDGLPTSTRDWRLFTAKVSTRLASRVTATSLSTEFTNA